MNEALIVLGSLGVIGALAHLALGERFVVAPLIADNLPTSFLGDGDITKRYLRWFWHVGTLLIAGNSVGLILAGTYWDSATALPLARLLAGQFLGAFAMFLIVAVPRPQLFLRVPQGALMGVGGALALIATN